MTVTVSFNGVAVTLPAKEAIARMQALVDLGIREKPDLALSFMQMSSGEWYERAIAIRRYTTVYDEITHNEIYGNA